MAVEVYGGGEAFDVVFGEGATGAGEGVVAVFAPYDEFGQHGVEFAADDVAFADAGVNADTGAGGFLVAGDGTGGGEEVAAGVFAVDAEFEGVADWLGVFGDVEFFAFGDVELSQY